MLKVGRMLGVWTQEFHLSHVSCRFTFARPAYLDSISELLDSCLSSSTKDCLSSRDWYFGHETYRFRQFCQFLFGLHIRTPWFLPPLQIHHLPKLKEWLEVFTCTLRVREEVVLTTVFIFSVSKLGEVVEFQCGSPSRFLLSSEDLFSPKRRPEKAPIFGGESHVNWFTTKPAR